MSNSIIAAIYRKTLPVQIKFSENKRPEKGSFSADVTDGVLWLPASFAALSRQVGAHNADTFFSLAADAPEIIMNHTGWTEEETAQATEKLRAQLRGHVPDVLLDFDRSQMPDFKFGAMPPPGFKPPQP